MDLALGILHGVQGIAVAAAGDWDVVLPVCVYRVNETVYRVNGILDDVQCTDTLSPTAVAVWLFMATAVAHLCRWKYAADILDSEVKDDLFRVFEWCATAPVMFMVIAHYSGITDAYALAAIYMLATALMPHLLWAATDRRALGVGIIILLALFAMTIGRLIQLRVLDNVNPPPWVVPLIALSYTCYGLFAVPEIMRAERHTKHIVYGVLSAVSKSYLSWTVVMGSRD